MTEGTQNIFEDKQAFHAALADIANSTEESPVQAEEQQQEASVPDDIIEESIEQEQVPKTKTEEDEDQINFLDTPQGKMIPKGRFQREINKRRDAESALQAERDARVRAERDLENMNRALETYFKPQNEQKSHTNNAEKSEFGLPEGLDPIDTETTRLLLDKINNLESQLSQKTNSDNTEKAMDNFGKALEQHQREFTAKQPDFTEAYQHLLRSTYQDYVDLGYSDKDAQQQTMISLQQKAAIAYKQGKNVAEVAYNMAKRAGYTAKTPTQAKQTVNIDKISENMKKTTSIGHISGAGAGVAGYVTGDAVSKLADSGGFIDKGKFNALLRKIQSGQE